MGGGDKTLLTVGGQSMLAAVIAALAVPDIATAPNGDPGLSPHSAGRRCSATVPSSDKGPPGLLAGLNGRLLWA